MINPGQTDTDADERGDACDNCPGAVNPFQDDLYDGDPGQASGATELCDGVDNDLDGSLDEGCDGACETPTLTDLFTIDATPGRSAVGLAMQRSDGRAGVSRTDEPVPGEEEMVLERGGPPWSPTPAASDPARSGAGALAWTGARVGVLSVDDRTGGAAPELRFSAQDDAGSVTADDVELGLSAAADARPDLAWDGRHLAATWRDDTGLARTARLDETGTLLQRAASPRGVDGDVREAAVARELSGGGSVLALLEGRPAGLAVLLERRDVEGGLVGAVEELAGPATGRSGIAVVATGSGYLAAWSEAIGSARILVVAADASGAPVGAPSSGAPAREARRPCPRSRTRAARSS